jgi:LysM repeat protein
LLYYRGVSKAVEANAVKAKILLLRLIAVLFGLAVPLMVAAQSEVTHVVQPGETLYRIALRYNVDLGQLAQTNNIGDVRVVYAGQTLVIPGLAVPSDAPEVENPLVAATPLSHVVQRGESLNTIASLYGITVAQILEANNIPNANRIYPGQELSIWTTATVDSASEVFAPTDSAVATAVAESVPATGPSTIIHVVRRGEYLSQIAGRYNVSWAEIAALNGIQNPDTVHAGHELLIPVTSTGTAAPVTVAPEPAPQQYVNHFVQRGEYLSAIAQRYGVGWSAIAAANGLSNPNTVYAGMTLRIPTSGAAHVQSQASTGVLPGDFPPPQVGVGREIAIDLSTQMVYAYENGVLVYSALSSTGLPNTPTVQGRFSVYRKVPSQTMSGPGYHLPGVESVLYFYQGYALHGAYWHNNFGQPMSRGCVNLTNSDAAWFYNFADIGTPVYVQY